MGKVLIIDDDQLICSYLQMTITEMGHTAEVRTTLQDGVAAVKEGEYDVVFLDVVLPDGSGLSRIKEIRQHRNAPEIIIMTGTSSSDGAEMAIKNGVWDYLQKPLLPEQNVILPIKRVLEYRENLRTSKLRPRLLQRKRIVGGSDALQRALEQLAQAASNSSNVLILGETGTGKEIFAHTLHENSGRAQHRLVVVDCAALPESLIESTLFGHVRGAFTNADKSVEGLVKLADKGSLFLDEIGELNLVLQKTLLRVLQEKTFRPVGATNEQYSDFRLIAATNKDLDAMVKQGTFREDLLFRLRSQVIELPPLRERLDDIEMLLVQYMRFTAERNGTSPKSYSPDLLEALKQYHWPGNVRELLHTVEQTIYAARESPILFPKHLPEWLRVQLIDSKIRTTTAQNPIFAELPSLHRQLQEMESLPSFKQYREMTSEFLEKKYLEQLLRVSGGTQKKAMSISKLGRTRLYTLLKKHGLS